MEPKGPKYTEALKHNNIKIITPLWIRDCIRDKELLNEGDYCPVNVSSLSTVCTLTVSSSKVSSLEEGRVNGMAVAKRLVKRGRKRKRRRKSGKEQPSLDEIEEDTFDTEALVTKESKIAMETQESLVAIETQVITESQDTNTIMETGEIKATVDTKVAMETKDLSLITDTLHTQNTTKAQVTIETQTTNCHQVSRLESVAESIMEEEEEERPTVLKCSLKLNNVKSKGYTISPTPQPATPSSVNNSEQIVKNDKSLLQGMVFCIVDYPDLMEKETIQQWGEVHTMSTCTLVVLQHTCTLLFSPSVFSFF